MTNMENFQNSIKSEKLNIIQPKPITENNRVNSLKPTEQKSEGKKYA